MQQSDQQFWHIVRAFLIRYNEYNREKGASPLQLEQFDCTHGKILAQHQLKQSAITKLTTMQYKSDYHNLILLAFLHDLAKWSSQYYLELSYHPAPLDAILTQSIQVLNNQQQFHTIVAKQHELIAVLLPLPYTFNHLDQLKVLYRKLKDIKDFFPVSIREHQKKCFLTSVEELIQKASKLKNIKVIEFIFNNIFNELEVLEENHEYVSQRLRVMKKIAKNLWLFHEQIIYRLAYLLMKFSYHVVGNPHLYSYLLPIYDSVLQTLTQRPAITALLIFKHLILNNIEKILKSNSSCILLQGLLRELAKIFTKSKLQYFMRHYDWNYLEVSICQQSLNILYEFCENRANQKKTEHELIKIYLNRIHSQIKHYLEEIKIRQPDEGKWKFYELKRKQYFQLLEEMNENPKKIFKEIEAIKNADVRDNFIQKCVRIVKKGSQLNNTSMINLMASDNANSALLFSAYAEIMLKQCREHNLEEFIRMFTSNFFLTGESQQIARVLDTITKFYYNHQEQAHRVLKSSDATYTFANAILILNTDLHNPKNQQKISQADFLKMCKKINDGEDIQLEILRKTYNNIKKNKINTFRDRGNMAGISVSNWLAYCADNESLPLEYYDSQLEVLDESCLQFYIQDVLTSIIDEKETAKLQLLVERFVYDDKVFQCEIIEVIRKVIDKKPHLPLHILEKILQISKFSRHNKVTERALSYYWLAANVITTFHHIIPTNIICQFLVSTWHIRIELQDNMQLRQSAQIRRIKQCIKTVSKREAKKSIMDMFSNFLSFKQSDDEKELEPNEVSKKTNFKSISNNVLDILKYKDNHRKLGIQFLISYIHQQQSKVYEQFVSCLFLIFNLLYVMDNCEEAAQDLFYELLGVKESSITVRLANLGKKDQKLFSILDNYCKFWILKILLKEYTPSKVSKKENNSYEYMLTKSLELLDKIDKEVLSDFMKEALPKASIHDTMFKSFERAISKVYGQIKVAEIDNFIQKFKKKEEEGKNKTKEQNSKASKESQKQNEGQKSQNVEPIKQEETAKELKKQPEPAKEKEVDQKVVQKQTSEKEIPSGENEEDKKDNKQVSPTRIPNVKKKSLQNDDQYVDPDAFIEKIDRQIETHLAQRTEQSSKLTPQSKKPQEKQPGNEQAVEELEAGQKEEDAPSIPVIMF